MSGSVAATTAEADGRDRARRVGASAVRWVRQNPPGGRWHTWMFTADDEADAMGPRADDLHLSPGSPTEYRLLEAVVRRTSGIRSTGRGLALAFPAGLRTDPDRPHAPGADGEVVFPAPDLVPAFLRRAVLGEVDDALTLPPASHLRVQGWVATVIHASLAHGSTSPAVEAALDAAPEPTAVRAATLEGVHQLVVAGELPGLPAELARWCGPELTARVVAGVYGRLPAMLRYADEHWPALGETLGRRTRELLDGTEASSPGT